jgi:GT2 family glycosyltransferase
MPLLLIDHLNAPVIAVMVNWNGKPYLQASLTSVLSELALHKGKLLLVDNDSSDGSSEFVLQYFPEVFILETGENLGGAGGFSIGMRTVL